ncbi:MAG: hypothetical protein JWN41_1737 [Thermoleophilia bacterium]|nr:hypothetical protein [Thermoleophilia bacterium]
MSNHLPPLRAPRWFVNTLYGTAFIGTLLVLAGLGDALSNIAIAATR